MEMDLNKFCDDFEKNTYSNNNFKIKIKVDKSDIHGNGVFATSYIKKEDIITIYPTDAYCLNNCAMIFRRKSSDDFAKNIKIYENTHAMTMCYENFNIKIIGNPYSYDNLKYVGHIVNDGLGNIFENISKSEINDNTKMRNLIINTFNDTKTKCNSMF